MSETKPKARRIRVAGDLNHHLYKRYDGRFELGYRNGVKQVWEGLPEGTTITQARVRRDEILAKRGAGQDVSSNKTLRFHRAADAWLADQVASLRPSTREGYRDSLAHALRAWGPRRLDRINVDDAARLVTTLRDKGLSEATIAKVLVVSSRVFKYARRRMRWNGTNPIPELESRERPQANGQTKRRLFSPDELAQTLRASVGVWKVLFALDAVTAMRQSEELGLRWRELDLADVDAASAHITMQLSRSGERVPLKTEESERTLIIPRGAALMLLKWRAKSRFSQDDDFAFATSNGTAISQRNAARALRAAMKRACDDEGRPTFPELHAVDAQGEPIPVKRGVLPSWHSWRHGVASEAISGGDSADELAWVLGHKDATVTRRVYSQLVQSVERQAERRAAVEKRYGGMLAALSDRPNVAGPRAGKPRSLHPAA